MRCHQGKHGPAVEYLERALMIARDIGDRDGERQPLYGLGNVYRSQGKYELAGEVFEQAVELATNLGRPWTSPTSSAHRVTRPAHSMAWPRLTKSWRQALAKLEEIGCNRVEEVSADDIRARLAEIGQDD